VTQTFGTGSSVTSADRSATFDSLNASGIDLSAYTEDQLDIWVDDTTYVGFDAFGGGAQTMFHYGTGGNNSYVTIKASDGASMFAIEFLSGSGFYSVFESGGPAYVVWEAFRDGVLVGSGNTGPHSVGTVLGWNDPQGFAELRVASYDNDASTFGDEQAIAIDDLSAQLGGYIVTNVPVPTLGPVGFILMVLLLALTPIAFRIFRTD